MHQWVPVKDTGHAGKYRAWHDRMHAAFENLPTVMERDLWVGRQFKSAKKEVYPILKSARAIMGYDVAPETVSDSGFRGLCAAIIMKLYNQGPRGVDKEQIQVWRRAFSTFFKKTGERPNLVPLHKALTKVNENHFFRDNPRWFIYCVSRMAGKNNGMVNMNGVESYMRNAMKFHKTKNPPRVDYDDPEGAILSQIRMGLISPKTAQKRVIKAAADYDNRVPSQVLSGQAFQLNSKTAGPPIDGGTRQAFSKGHRKKLLIRKKRKKRKL